jgi:hypothetical protein
MIWDMTKAQLLVLAALSIPNLAVADNKPIPATYVVHEDGSYRDLNDLDEVYSCLIEKPTAFAVRFDGNTLALNWNDRWITAYQTNYTNDRGVYASWSTARLTGTSGANVYVYVWYPDNGEINARFVYRSRNSDGEPCADAFRYPTVTVTR